MVEYAAAPPYTDLSLFHAILDPIEGHVYRLGLLDFSAIVCKSICPKIVCADGRCLGLGLSYFMYQFK
jgi:hypothetical protein